MIDFTALNLKLNPQPQLGGADELRLRVGVVTVVNSNGTVDLTLAETEVTAIPVLNGVPLFVGSVVQLLTYRGALLVLGTVAEAADEDSSVAFSTTPIQPLVSASASDGSIITVSHAFKVGYAYEIGWEWCAQLNGGTSPFAPYSRIRRASATGTVIEDLITHAAVTTNFIKMRGSVIVKCTVANTTQTIVLCGGYSSSGAPTSMDVEATSTRRTRLTVRRIGTATKYSGALEVPTA